MSQQPVAPVTARRFLVALGIALIWLAPIPIKGQKPMTSARTWAPQRTAWGDPDLQGAWNNATPTPLERPSRFGGKEILTDDEEAEVEVQALEDSNRDRRDGGPEVDVGRAYNDFWNERGKPTKQTSLIVDPPDGRLPLLTPAAQKKADAGAAARRRWSHLDVLRRGPADGPEDRPLSERCVLYHGVPPLPTSYNNNYLITQTPGYVTILSEMIHELRVIPLDGRPHLPQQIRQLMGDSRGHWDGNTLVVETTNYSDATNFRFPGSGATMRMVERFARVDADTIDYRFTVDDPATYTKPWTASLPMSRIEGPLFEYACHEGNYGMMNLLAGARADEKGSEGNGSR